MKVRFHNTRGWSFSFCFPFCCLLAWGVCSSTLQIHFKHAFIILTKGVYSISENLRSRHTAEESTVNRLFFFPRKNIRDWKVYCVGVIVYPVQYSSIALFVLVIQCLWLSITSLCSTLSLLKFWKLIIIKQ